MDEEPRFGINRINFIMKKDESTRLLIDGEGYKIALSSNTDSILTPFIKSLMKFLNFTKFEITAFLETYNEGHKQGARGFLNILESFSLHSLLWGQIL